MIIYAVISLYPFFYAIMCHRIVMKTYFFCVCVLCAFLFIFFLRVTLPSAVHLLHCAQINGGTQSKNIWCLFIMYYWSRKFHEKNNVFCRLPMYIPHANRVSDLKITFKCRRLFNEIFLKWYLAIFHVKIAPPVLYI